MKIKLLFAITIFGNVVFGQTKIKKIDKLLMVYEIEKKDNLISVFLKKYFKKLIRKPQIDNWNDLNRKQ